MSEEVKPRIGIDPVPKQNAIDMMKDMAKSYSEDRAAFLAHVQPDPELSHEQKVYEVAKLTLQGFLSGPNLNILLVNAMTSSVRKTLGQIIVDEAWDMAECLVEKLEQSQVVT